MDEIDPAELQRALAEFAEQVAAALTPVITAAAKVLSALASDPVIRFAMEHPELLQRGEPVRLCHCFCSVAHPGESGVCTGDATKTLARSTRRMGVVGIPVCEACEGAYLAALYA